MRPILFRGFYETPTGGKTIYVDGVKKAGEWIEGSLSIRDFNEREYFIRCFNSMQSHKVIPETVGQYTGLDDVNGVKIFEGDVLRSIYNYDIFIAYDNENASFSGMLICNDTHSCKGIKYAINHDQSKVTGTIFDEVK